jgi:MoxR-like ATPase
MTTQTETFCYVPEVDANHIPWGNFEKIEKVIASGKFYPVWVTGPSGNGKSTTIEQVCAKLNREFVRVNFTNETSEDDLIGGNHLIASIDEKGNRCTVTEFRDGPVVNALRAGAVLLLDEVDAGHTNRILCLQSVLEGRGVLIKSTGEWVKPRKGFNVLATSNTQGRGSDDGRYIGTNVQNGAFLDRFSAMLHQTYPNKEIEEKILKNYFFSFIEGNESWVEKYNKMSDAEKQESVIAENKWMGKLCDWAAHIRKLFDDGVGEEVITTRSLINIIQAFAIYNDKVYAVKVACDRFNAATSDSFQSLYQKMSDDTFVPEPPKEEPKTVKTYHEFV